MSHLSAALRARNELGATAARKDFTPEQIAAARHALDEATLDAQVKAIVDRAPELTPAQYEQLARALGEAPAANGAGT